MMNTILISVFLLVLSACTLPAKQSKQVQDTPISNNQDEVVLKNWADDYYYKTFFIVKNPTIMETYNEIVKVCKSKDINFNVAYKSKNSFSVKYKEIPITIKTKSGFSKVVFVSKGACREFSLFKSAKINPKKQFRSSIKTVTLMYVYNQGTYLKDIVFKTPHKDVEFLVE